MVLQDTSESADEVRQSRGPLTSRQRSLICCQQRSSPCTASCMAHQRNRDQRGPETEDCCLRIVECADDIIYVEDTEEKNDVELDGWKHDGKSSSSLIKNIFNHILVASPENSTAHFQDLTVSSSQEDHCRFILHLYKDTSCGSGIPVSFTVQAGSKTYHMYCTKDKSIEFREGEPLKLIPGNTSDIIFYKQVFSVGTFRFQSSLLSRCYLAWERGSNRLYLKEVFDEVDEACKLTVPNRP
ncbi:hypothetical protein NDU88_006105 [Pleurodeles waltl]|uniref:Interleukin-1 n=1 Tax=Pleurodeles waltl TaxID=8319 RepID=A0AAV7UKM3_PLEWA|nr:hypothetical protein NDU88_006105 [Pleurodeles waltl]